MTMTLPTLEELTTAARTVHSVLPPTPQYAWPLLAERLGTEVWVKHENHMVPSFHSLLVRGVGTYGLELFSAVSDLDVVYVPIGLGSGICGVIAARDALGSRADVVGVVSSHAPAYAASFRARQAVELPARTRLADGMACRTPNPQALEVILNKVDRIVEVSDDEVAAAMRMVYECTHNVAEGAGAAALAAAIQERSRLASRRVGVVLTGGNVDRDVFAEVLSADAP